MAPALTVSAHLHMARMIETNSLACAHGSVFTCINIFVRMRKSHACSPSSSLARNIVQTAKIAPHGIQPAIATLNAACLQQYKHQLFRRIPSSLAFLAYLPWLHKQSRALLSKTKELRSAHAGSKGPKRIMLRPPPQHIKIECTLSHRGWQESTHAPHAETMRETSSGPSPLPKSSRTVCIASATPRVSGSFTFSRIALCAYSLPTSARIHTRRERVSSSWEANGSTLCTTATPILLAHERLPRGCQPGCRQTGSRYAIQ